MEKKYEKITNGNEENIEDENTLYDSETHDYDNNVEE